jgi:hypothetical protein
MGEYVVCDLQQDERSPDCRTHRRQHALVGIRRWLPDQQRWRSRRSVRQAGPALDLQPVLGIDHSYLQCIAVSTTSDATGTYNRYSFQYTDFDDYPKMSVWPDAYYETFNMFAGGTTFAGADACAYNRAAMMAGTTATQVCFQQSTAVGGLLPSDLDGTTAPPTGSPNYMMYFGTNNLNLFKFHVDFTTPTNSTFTGPTVINVAAFSPVCGGGTCIPQPGTSNTVDSLADRLMYRLAYRNFGNHESLVVNHSVSVAPLFMWGQAPSDVRERSEPRRHG